MLEGKYIVIEGVDCSGKETQSKLLEERLKKEGYDVVRFSFPVYDSPTGKIIGGDFLGIDKNSMFKEGPVGVDPKVSCLYYAADRKYNIKRAEEYIDKGYFVILDRYISSNMAYQGSKIEDENERFYMYNWIDKLEYWLLELPRPDMTIYLNMPYEYTKVLKQNRKTLDEIEKSDDYLKKSVESYIELSELYNWTTIDCVKDKNIRSKEDIAEEIYNKVVEKLLK